MWKKVNHYWWFWDPVPETDPCQS